MSFQSLFDMPRMAKRLVDSVLWRMSMQRHNMILKEKKGKKEKKNPWKYSYIQLFCPLVLHIRSSVTIQLTVQLGILTGGKITLVMWVSSYLTWWWSELLRNPLIIISGNQLLMCRLFISRLSLPLDCMYQGRFLDHLALPGHIKGTLELLISELLCSSSHISL